jgi:hypothetical protein
LPSSGVLFRKSLPIPVHFSVFFILSCSSITGSRIQFQSSTCRYAVFPALFVQEAVFSPTCFGLLWQKSMAVPEWVCDWVFYYVSLVFISVFVPVPCFPYYYGFVVWIKVKYHDTFGFAYDNRHYLRSFWVSIWTLGLIFLSEECHWNFGGIVFSI